VRLFDLERGGSLDLLGLGGYSQFELPGTLRNDEVEAGLVDFYDAYDPLSEGISARGLMAPAYVWRRGGHEVSLTGHGGYRQLELRENYTGFLVNPVEGDRRDQSQEAWSVGLIGRHESRLAGWLGLRTGLGVRGDLLEQREDGLGRNLEVVSTRRDLEVAQLIAHALAGLCWTPSDDVRVDAGARVDWVQVGVTDHLEGDAQGDGALVVVSPRLTSRWTPVDDLRLFAAYGRGFRPPEARAFSSFDAGRAGISEEVYQGGEPAITVSDALEVGTRWDPAAAFGMSLSGFLTFIERESIFDHVSGVSLELNGTRRMGGELVLYSNPLPWLSLSADLTLVDARFVESGNRVPLAPWLVSGLRATVTHDRGVRAGLRVLTVGPRPLPHGATGATLVMADATLGYHWRWLRLELEVENLLDRQLREGEYHYASHWRPGEPASEIPVLHTTAGPPLNARLTLGVLF
jgi:outer membrane receptor protein involved in Fe transport